MASLISVQRRGSVTRRIQPRKASRKTAYPIEFMRAVVRLVEENPKLKASKLQEVVREKFHWDVPLATLYDMVRQKDRWFRTLSIEGYRHKDPEWSALEKELLEWCIDWVRRHGTLTYVLLREQALILAKKLGEDSRPMRTKKIRV